MYLIQCSIKRIFVSSESLKCNPTNGWCVTKYPTVHSSGENLCQKLLRAMLALLLPFFCKAHRIRFSSKEDVVAYIHLHMYPFLAGKIALLNSDETQWLKIILRMKSSTNRKFQIIKKIWNLQIMLRNWKILLRNWEILLRNWETLLRNWETKKHSWETEKILLRNWEILLSTWEILLSNWIILLRILAPV